MKFSSVDQADHKVVRLNWIAVGAWKKPASQFCLSALTQASKKKTKKTDKQTKNAETQKWEKQASKVLLCNKLYYNLFTSLQVRSYLS